MAFMLKLLRMIITSLMPIISLSVHVQALAGDFGESGFNQNVPSISSNYQYPPGWFDGEQKLSLPSSGETITTKFIPAGATVNVNISGDIGFWPQASYGLDAAYIYYVPPGTIYYPVTTPRRSLIINTSNGKFDPQPPIYNPAHAYDWQTVGTGKSLTFKIGDSYYDDNSGSFSVTITW